MSVVEVFADVRCPFTHVGLRRLVEHRERTGADLALWIRAWPLELVNAAPLDGRLIAEEITALRTQLAPDLFRGYRASDLPASSLPALGLAAAAYQHSRRRGEEVSLLLRDALFEHGLDISQPGELQRIADAVGMAPPPYDPQPVLDDWHEGQQRGVIGSPHFFVGEADFFCPTLRIEHGDTGLRVSYDEPAFEDFLRRCAA